VEADAKMETKTEKGCLVVFFDEQSCGLVVMIFLCFVEVTAFSSSLEQASYSCKYITAN
jgi:hypothetical protein